MGDLNVKSVRSQEEAASFMRHLLKDIHAMERMIADGMFEADITRIGAEQELCLVDTHSWKPANINLEVLKIMNDPMLTTELGRFNLETNAEPHVFTGKAISDMHNEVKNRLEGLQVKLDEMDAMLVLCGILPSIRKSDVTMDNLTPIDRYYALMNGITALRGNNYELRISGIDELNIKQQSPMLEACNTSFQIHLQVAPEHFAQKYNIAQAMAAPVMAAAVNSPLLFGRRLWRETRIALFQQSIDVRSFSEHIRDRSPRVTFGDHWIKNGITDIYKEDLARFQILLSSDIDEDTLAVLAKGKTPKLRALQIHNSTVYRWNRPCYGISDNGKPHLRIENRILPSGPTLPDSFANAAFWYGLMNGFEDHYPDITKVMDFDDAKSNFFTAAQFGLDAQITWVNKRNVQVKDLILNELLPISREGLVKAKIDKGDIDRYLGIIEDRVRSGQTGANWMLNSFSRLAKEGATPDEISITITAYIAKNQHEGKPVHTWETIPVDELEYIPALLRVEEAMSTNLITAQEDDIVEFVANLMDWKQVRHIPVEDKHGNLVGLITWRQMLRHFANSLHHNGKGDRNVKVKDLMIRDPHTISPHATITDAMDIMVKQKVGCLPVVNGTELVGIITEQEFLATTGNLLRRLAKKRKGGDLQALVEEAAMSDFPHITHHAES